MFLFEKRSKHSRRISFFFFSTDSKKKKVVYINLKFRSIHSSDNTQCVCLCSRLRGLHTDARCSSVQ